MFSKPFVAFSPSHLIVLALVVLVSAVMIGVARAGRWPRATRAQEWILCGLMLVAWPLDVWAASFGSKGITLEHVLPLHLCDLASFAGIVALLRRDPFAAEIAWFWGMAGTLNGLLTPALLYDFPNPAFFSFFLLHAGVIITAIYLVGGPRLWPRPGAVMRVFVLSLGYFAFVATTNALLGTNFAFVCHKPETPSLLDSFGPHPWYVLALPLLALVAFILFYLPFWALRKFWPEFRKEA